MPDLPAAPGSYALTLILPAPARLAIGRLGTFLFPPGLYLYLGSAHGPGGLHARLRHHFQTPARPHWHIDHLRLVARLQGGWYSLAPSPLECEWSAALAALSDAEIPVPGFGASDCASGCASHLVAFPINMDTQVLSACLSKYSPARYQVSHFRV